MPFRVITDDVCGRDRAAGGRGAGRALRRAGARSVTRLDRPGCTPRRGSANGRAGGTPPMSAAPISPAPPWWTAWNGTCACRRGNPRVGAQIRRDLRQLLGRTRRSRRTTPTASWTPGGSGDARARPIGPTGPQLSGLEVRPYPYQTQILEALESERTVHDRHRNLVVAATGPERRWSPPWTTSLWIRKTRAADRLLFVAHRRGDPRAVAAHLPRGAG